MKKNIKFIAGITAATLALGMTGCKVKTNNQVQTGDNGLPIIRWYNYGPQVREMELVFDEVSKYTSEKIGANVECTNIPGSEWDQKMNLIKASKEQFDMCFTSSGRNFHSDVSKNCFIPLDDLLQNEGKDIYNLMPQDSFLSAMVNGKIYAVPAYKDNAFRYSISYNTSLTEKIGFDVNSVKNLYDIEPALEKYKEMFPDNVPLGIYATYNFYPMLGLIDVADGIAVDIDDASGKIINPWETEKAEEFFTKMHEWFNKGYIYSDAATRLDKNGMSNTLMDISQMLPYQRMMSNSSLPEDEIMKDIDVCDIWLTGTAGSMVAISKTSAQPEKTMEFINLLNTDEYLRNLVAYGIEDRHYVKVGENHWKYPEGVAKRDDNSYFSYPFTQGNMFITKTQEGTPDDIWEKYKEFDANAVKAPNFGFAFDSTPVKSEQAAVSNVVAKYKASLYTGAANPKEYLPKAIEELKAAGIDKIIAEAQKQLDQFKKDNIN